MMASASASAHRGDDSRPKGLLFLSRCRRISIVLSREFIACPDGPKPKPTPQILKIPAVQEVTRVHPCAAAGQDTARTLRVLGPDSLSSESSLSIPKRSSGSNMDYFRLLMHRGSLRALIPRCRPFILFRLTFIKRPRSERRHSIILILNVYDNGGRNE
jgi:hypothetical protein